MAPLFKLPDEVILTPLLQSFPGRDHQIRSLATLLHPDAIPCRNIVVHGTEATGKTAVTTQLLASLSSRLDGALRSAAVNAAQCITARHLFERTVAAVADALRTDQDHGGGGGGGAPAPGRRCETLAQLAVEMSTMLKDPDRDPRWRFVLVLDALDRQRDAPATLLPALARLSETIPCLTCVFIVTAPPAGSLRGASSPHLHFPPYAKADFVRILALAPPPALRGASPQETADLWTRFAAAVHDALVRPASRTLPALRRCCRALWPRFAAPVESGALAPREFSKLLVAARTLFQDESLLNPSIVSVRPGASSSSSATGSSNKGLVNGVAPTAKPAPSAAELTALLPIAARLLLIAAYLASHNAPRHDLTLFSTHHHGRRRRRRGGTAASSRGAAGKHRKIARKLLGAHAFVLERMMAVFEAVRGEWRDDHGAAAVGAAGLDGDVGMAIATLASLRLLVRVGGGGDVMDRAGKWRINVGWEVVRGIGRSIGVEVEEWLIE